MIVFDAKEDIKNRRRVVLKGSVVTIIDLAGRRARIAEDGQWYPHKMFFPLTEDDITQEHIESIKSHLAGKRIATVKPQGAGVQLVLLDNTRLDISYAKDDGLSFSVIDSDGQKVL